MGSAKRMSRGVPRKRGAAWAVVTVSLALSSGVLAQVEGGAPEPDGGPIACSDSAECVSPEPYCHETLGECVQCLSNNHCGYVSTPGSYYSTRCDVDSGRCIQCDSHAQCAGQAPYCGADGLCVACLSDLHCTSVGAACVDGHCGYCGDGACAYPETTYDCPNDCPRCGDGICAANETVQSCVYDCDTCGNGVCGPYESPYCVDCGGYGGGGGYFDGGYGGYGSGPGSYCGNGVVELGEQCDAFSLGGQSCASATMGARPAGTLYCTSYCALDTSWCQPSSVGGGGTFGGLGGSGWVDAGPFDPGWQDASPWGGSAGSTGLDGSPGGSGGGGGFGGFGGFGGTLPAVPPSDPVSTGPCVPGEQRSCACGLGLLGYQICAESGMELGACVCDGTAPDGGPGPTVGDPGGCSCRVAQRPGSSGAPAWLLALGVMSWRLRRREGRRDV